MKTIIACILTLTILLQLQGEAPPESGRAVRIGIAGLSHSHVVPLLREMGRCDVEIVGFAEQDTSLCHRYSERFGFDQNLVYASLEEMPEQCEPEGVVTFTSIYDHRKVIETCSPRGIHVMVEKPLAVSVAHARRMEKLAEQHDILLLTNYETSWYPSTHRIETQVAPTDLSALETNLTVVEILEVAMESHRTGKTVSLEK